MATARLPGIYFETVAPPPPALLPRMDITAFAGFLPSGPIDLPFAVEDPARFQEIFGVDLPLAWDRASNSLRLAQTPPAVRSFFREGGRRCWIVRLADKALFNRWVIPGLLEVDSAGGFHAGWVQARSEGSWSDDLNVNATLLETPLPAVALDTSGNAPRVSGLDPGDVVQLYFPSTGTLAYHSATDSRWFWFGAASPAVSPALQPDSVTFLGPGIDVALPFTSLGSDGSELVLHVTRDTALTVPPGSWLRMRIGGQTLLFQVESMEAGLSTPSSPGADESASLTSTLAWWVLDGETAWSINRANVVQISTVTFELWAWPEGSPVMTIADLGLAADNARSWGLLPTDAVLYAPVERPAPIPYAALAGDIDYPRFPVAAPMVATLGLPLGMTTLVRSDFTQGASLPGASALERDGLASFGAGVSGEGLFIDSRLSGSELATLQQDAFFVQYQAQNPSPPTGIYALLGIDEVSLVAVPDAIQPGWRACPPQVQQLATPDPLQVSQPDAGGKYTVSWGAVPKAAGYTLQEAGDPLFATTVTSRDAGANLSLALTNGAQCGLELYYRVAAYGAGGNSPWSVTASVELRTGSFLVCNQQLLLAPQLQLFDERTRIILEWTLPSGVADGFTLQTSGDPQFQSPSTPYQGNLTRFEYWNIPGSPAYFRANAQRGGESSPWSNTVETAPAPVAPYEVLADPNPPTLLLDIHRALLRMSSARGDMVAILSVPASYRRDETAGYQILLAQKVAPEDTTGRMLSYGALYHPWVVVRDNTQPLPLSLRTVVPDGSVCGIIAAKALSSGAWIAPANIAINSAVALAPTLQDDAPAVFAANQINLIAQQPEGFLVMDQDTLIADLEFQPLNVRRLLILLRRLALREGVRYIFQNITPTFQRAVTRQFEQWMQQLLSQGAFSGRAAQDSYRVIADASVNPPDAIDQGQFVVVLQVAPARPMRFLTVKLVQSGGTLTIEEG